MNKVLDEYREQLDKGGRYVGFKIALELFKQNGGQVIVETGCMRMENDFEGAGGSTYLFGRVAKDAGQTDGLGQPRAKVRVFSVDNNPENVETAKKLTEGLPVEFYTNDSIEFLREWATPIDLLYLDSMDCDPKFDADNSLPQEHNLTEFKAAEGKLTPRAVIVLDDNDFTNGGKTAKTNEYLRQSGRYIQLWDGKQAVWMRR